MCKESGRIVHLRNEYITKLVELRKRDDVVFVYLDESYIHRYHTKGYTWYHKDEEIQAATAGQGKGERLIDVSACVARWASPW